MNELREQMWELCYDLLPAEQRDGLIARIKSDPQAARLYAEVRLQADLVGYAAKVEDSSLIFSAEGKESKLVATAPAAGRQKEMAQAAPLAPGQADSRRFRGNWLVATAALLLVGVIGYGFWRPLGAPQQVAGRLVVTEVEVSSPMRPGLSNKIVLRNRSIDGLALSAPTDVKVVDSQGQVRYHEMVQTGEDGRASVEVPGLAIVAGARLEVEADRQLAERSLAEDRILLQGERKSGELAAVVADDAQQRSESANFLSIPLPVSAESPLVYYLFEKPVAEPGQSLRFAAIGLDRFNFEPVPPRVSELALNNSQGELVVQPMWQASGNVVEGTVELPAEAAAGALALTGRDKSGEDVIATIDMAPAEGKLGGAADRSNFRYFQDEQLAMRSARSPRGAGDLRRSRQDVLKQETEQPDGAGSAPAQQSADKDRAKLKESVGFSEKELAEVAGRQWIEAGQGVNVDLGPELEDKKLSAEIVSRGVTVARRKISAGQPGQGIRFDLPPEVDGSIRVDLIDTAQSPEQVVGQQYFYRRPARELTVQAENAQAQYAPGELVRLRLKVNTENGDASPATLGVRVWNETYVAEDAADRWMLVDAVRGLTAVPNPSQAQVAGLAAADFSPERLYGAGGGVEGAPPSPEAAIPLAATPADASAEALAEQDLSAPLGGGVGRGGAGRGMAESFGGSRAVPESEAMAYQQIAPQGEQAPVRSDDAAVLLVSNEAQVKSRHRVLLGESQERWQAWQATVGRVLIGGGVLALAAMGGLFLLRMPVRTGSGTLALVAATASLIVGAVWVSRPQSAMHVASARPARSVSTPRPGLDAYAEKSDEAALAPRDAPAARELPAPAAEPDAHQPAGLSGETKSIEAQASEADERPRERVVQSEIESSPPPAPAAAPAAPALVRGAVRGDEQQPKLEEEKAQTAKKAADALPAGAEPGAREAGRKAADILLKDESAVRDQPAPAAPTSLYFNPQLATDSDGFVTIEFRLPDVESEYRVLIDAFGQGRVGSAVLPIVCRKN